MVNAGPKVRGVCPAGHITDTVAEPKRLTAYVDCAHEGCPHKVNCRRIPKDATPAPSIANPAETPDPHRLIKVDSYGKSDTGKPAGLAVEPDPAAGPGPGPGPVGPKQEPEAEALPDPVDVADEPRSKRLARRLRGARSAGGSESGYRHPLTGL